MTEAATQEIRFGAKAHAGFSDDTATRIAEELELMSSPKRAYGVTAEEFVEAAASGKAPTCAQRLTWNDEIAGYQWRLQEARLTLNHITMIETDEEGEESEMRAFHVVNVEVENGEKRTERRYVPLRIIREDAALIEQVIEEAASAFRHAGEKLRLYESHVREYRPELALLMDAVDEHLSEEDEENEEESEAE